MITYQDYLAAEDVGELLLKAVSEHQESELYRTALDARLYDQQRNPTISQYQKLLYTITGSAVPDNYSANHKIASGFFPFFVTQQNQYLLETSCCLYRVQVHTSRLSIRASSTPIIPPAPSRYWRSPAPSSPIPSLCLSMKCR